MMTEQRTRLTFLQLIGSLMLAAILATGCGKDEPEETTTTIEHGLDSVDTKFVTMHPILDAQVQKGDSLLMNLIALKDEGLLLEGDMARLVGGFVREHGGYENPDSVLLGMTYRQLIDRALLLDLSGEYGYDPDNCEGCTDSILIFLPATNARLYVGMGRKGLQEMIREALAENKVADQYQKEPYNQKIDSTNWQRVIDKIAREESDQFDGVLFGNIMILLAREGKFLNDYTYGHLLTVIDRVKTMPEFAEVRTYLENLAADRTPTEPKTTD